MGQYLYEAVYQGERVALKLGDIWQYPELEKEMLCEAEIYISLKKLQGRTIPKLKGYGYTAGGLFAIVTDIAGSPIKAEDMNNEQCNKAVVNALAQIHKHGILHGDIRRDNILVKPARNRIKVSIIDFGFSRKILDEGEAQREMMALKKMLGSSS